MFMLDTNMASYALRGSPPDVRLRMLATPRGDLSISEITRAELLSGAGVVMGAKGMAFRQAVESFCAAVTVLPWDAAASYAELTVSSRKRGTTLSAFDMLIAAHALSTCTVLVTHDKAFGALRPRLPIEDWAVG